nr:unnamed protein product [Spirometra erinaceieuropaei]
MGRPCARVSLLTGLGSGLVLGSAFFIWRNNARGAVLVSTAAFAVFAACSNLICRQKNISETARDRLPFFEYKRQLDQRLAQRISTESKRLDVAKIRQTSTAEALSREIRTCFTTRADGEVSNQLSSLKTSVYGAAEKILGYTQRRRCDWIIGRTLQLSAQTAQARSRNDDYFRQFRKMTAKSARDDRKQYWTEIETSMEQASNFGDTRELHLLIRQVSGEPSTLSDSGRDVNGNFTADNSAKVKRWREHLKHHLNFDTQPTSPLLSSAAEFLPSPTYAVPCESLSEGEVVDVIRKFRNNKAPGEDGIPAELLKSCVDTLAPWLHEIRVYRASVRSVLLYGCDCWALRVEDGRKLEIFDHYRLRTIFRVKFTDFVSNETARARCDNIARITQAIQERRLRWLGHVFRRPPQELSVIALDTAPLPYWKPRRGRQFETWLDTVRQDMEVVLGPSVFGLRRWRREWVELSRSAAADRHAWRGTVRDIIEAG